MNTPTVTCCRMCQKPLPDLWWLHIDSQGNYSARPCDLCSECTSNPPKGCSYEEINVHVITQKLTAKQPPNASNKDLYRLDYSDG